MNEALMIQNYVGMLLLFNSNFILSQYIVPPLTVAFTWTVVCSFAGYTSSHTVTALVRCYIIVITGLFGNHQTMKNTVLLFLTSVEFKNRDMQQQAILNAQDSGVMVLQTTTVEEENQNETAHRLDEK